MDEFLTDIIEALRNRSEPLRPEELESLARSHNQGISDNANHVSKRKALAAYRRIKQQDPQRWERWAIDPELEGRLIATLRLKPRRTASGVATVTTITKPWACSGSCLYCPNDVRMPKSYLSNEPACQRAERCYFDPYLQVITRLRTLRRMGHVIDKVEIIVLGGTWTEYPKGYRTWFASELFRALNEFEGIPDERAAIDSADASSDDAGAGSADAASDGAGAASDDAGAGSVDAASATGAAGAAGEFATQDEGQRRAFYEALGIANDPDVLARRTEAVQKCVSAGKMTHAQGIAELYGNDPAWQQTAALQTADIDELKRHHKRNESAANRCVGLCFELRPDGIDCASLMHLRELGATKIQFGVQSLSQETLDANCRGAHVEDAVRAFALCRLFGFKIHAHFMANLLGSTPEADAADYRLLVADERFLPDEVKMYPCVLIAGSALETAFNDGAWKPYDEPALVELLAKGILETPPYMRISRMIRDFAAEDIAAGNKKVNLREAVEARARELAEAAGTPIHEIRCRELASKAASSTDLMLEDVEYETSVSREHFFQWTTRDGSIAGFLRLSLPDWNKAAHVAKTSDLPIENGQAMIREVHVYGKVAALGKGTANAQHKGLGTSLIEKACETARNAGYDSINVISAIGTRGYYRARGFEDAGLYQRRMLSAVTNDGAGNECEGQSSVIEYEDRLCRALMEINTKFYRDNATSFAATRESSWDGWKRCLPYLAETPKPPETSGEHEVRVLDVACGNLRFERFLTSEAPAALWSFDAVDACRELLADGVPANTTFYRMDVLDALGVNYASEGNEAIAGEGAVACPEKAFGPRCPYDAVVCFGFMHHIPTQRLRRQLLCALVDKTRPGGVVIVSFWRFLDDEAFARKARKAHAENITRLADAGIGAGAGDLGENDKLLGWQNKEGACRYCHSFTDADIDELVGSVSIKADVADRFRSDGHSGRMNEYLVLRINPESSLADKA